MRTPSRGTTSETLPVVFVARLRGVPSPEILGAEVLPEVVSEGGKGICFVISSPSAIL